MNEKKEREEKRKRSYMLCKENLRRVVLCGDGRFLVSF